jgi:hypothetical protein
MLLCLPCKNRFIAMRLNGEDLKPPQDPRHKTLNASLAN